MTLEQAQQSAQAIWSAADDVQRMCRSEEAQEAYWELRQLAWKAEDRVTQIQREENKRG